MTIDRIDPTSAAEITLQPMTVPVGEPVPVVSAPDARQPLDAALARIAALEARVAELSAKQAAVTGGPQRLRAAQVRGEADRHAADRAAARQKVDELMRPGLRRTLLEILELGLRLLPLVNALIALVRIGRMAWAAVDPVRRRELDWSQEWTRLAIDLAGVAGSVLIPGIGGALGATGALAANLVYTDRANEGLGVRGGSSQLFGGLNELVDDYPVRNGLRERAACGWDAAKAGAAKLRDAAGVHRSVSSGAAGDDGSRPLLPAGAPPANDPGPALVPIEVST